MAQKNDSVKAAGYKAAELVGPSRKELPAGEVESVHDPDEFVRPARPTKKAGAEYEIREAGGHDQTAIIQVRAEFNYADSRIPGKRCGKRTLSIAGDNQMFGLGFGFQQRLDSGSTFRAVAGSGQ
jgi:hypothetical protein